MRNSRHKLQVFQSARMQAAGILLLIFLAILLLWFNDINSTQATSAIAAKVRFYGEYRIGDGQWQEIMEGQHIPSTKGDVTLTDVFTVEGIEKEYMLRVALAVAEASTPPISRALIKGAEPLEGLKNFEIQEISGKGMQGASLDGETKIIFGNKVWMEDNGITIPDELADGLIGSVSYVAINGTLLGCCCFNDTVRDEAKSCI